MRPPPSSTRRQVTSTLFIVTVGLLAGCISVFPESEPAQLYRFGDSVSSTNAAAAPGPTFKVFLGQTEFNRAAAGDRILTVSGYETAYIKGARWVSSAEDLFGDALRKSLSDTGGPAQLVGNDGAADADYLLSIQVQTFEARYLNGPDAAPDIAIAVRAILTSTQNRDLVAEQEFRSSISANENRVGAIVGAFDQATALLLDDLGQWTNTRGRPVHR